MVFEIVLFTVYTKEISIRRSTHGQQRGYGRQLKMTKSITRILLKFEDFKALNTLYSRPCYRAW